MSKYLYDYNLQIAKDERNCYFRVHKWEIVLENDTQWVIKIGERYSIVEKEKTLHKYFRQKDWLWNYSHYSVYLYTTECNAKQIRRIKMALNSLVEENCFITEIAKSIDLKAMLVEK